MKKTISRIALALLLISLLAFALYRLGGEKIDPELKARVEEYYLLEKKNKWFKAYHFRVPRFREDVRFMPYAQGMKRGMKGWVLNEIVIRGARVSGDRAEVEITFRETYGGENRNTTETTAWERVDGLWYVSDAGTRGHLPFNSPERPPE